MSHIVTLRVDPFFDDEEEGFTPGNEPGVQAFAKAYKDPSQERMKNGQPITAIAGAGPRGIGMGVLIPHATPGGVPRGIEPNKINDIEINIDPQLPGQSARLRLGDLHDGLMQEAMADAQEMVPDASTLARHRRQASAAFRAAAEHIAAGDVPAPEQSNPELERPTRRATSRKQTANLARPTIVEQTTPAVQPAKLAAFTGKATVAAPAPPPMPRQVTNFGPPPLQQSVAPQALAPMPGGGMLASFGATQQVAAAPAVSPMTTPTGVPAPSIQVQVEIEHFGDMEAWFHDVQQQGDSQLLLVYNLAYKGGSKWFPPRPSENSPRMALRIAGHPQVCLVEHSGTQYVYDNKEMCLLNVLQVGDLNEAG